MFEFLNTWLYVTLLIPAFFILINLSGNKPNLFFANVWVVAGLIYTLIVTHTNPITFIWDNLMQTGLFIAAYFVCGIFYVRFHRYKKLINESIAHYKPMESTYKSSWANYNSKNPQISYEDYLITRDIPPMPWNHKAEITKWIGYWVFFLVNDIVKLLWDLVSWLNPWKFIKRVSIAIYDWMSSSLKNLALEMFRKAVG